MQRSKKSKNQLNETTLLKQQLEGQINVLKRADQYSQDQ